MFMFKLLAPLLALAALPSLAAPFYMEDIASYVAKDSAADAGVRTINPGPSGTPVAFTSCDAQGTVSGVTISPCESGDGTAGSPCVFTNGNHYTINITYTPDLAATSPRSGLAAHDATESYGADSYAYSGQSFNGCEYTACPVVAAKESEYTYEFVTLDSVFDGLTFNLTTDVFGPSIMCASIPVAFSS
ncbi:hypothetical protein EHS25_000535 [Saitozyma podzolica]|uniref:Phosphatidylglycerol/phosphatidylinositol transfer protein n=1 Tax=Saitozyma podzolica TaxID=1890683 RepID=A0A427YWD0_9TREE|nr:hypothetical protein EHS25_000535 [Saitozyma podzolica]